VHSLTVQDRHMIMLTLLVLKGPQITILWGLVLSTVMRSGHHLLEFLALVFLYLPYVDITLKVVQIHQVSVKKALLTHAMAAVLEN